MKCPHVPHLSDSVSDHHQGTLLVRRLLFWLYHASLRLNLAVRHRFFQLYLNQRKTHLAGADLSFLNLSRTNLSRADLREVSFIRADLRGTNLAHCDLRGTDFSGALLRGADLTGALLTGAEVTAAQLATAKSLAGALLPDGSRYGAAADLEGKTTGESAPPLQGGEREIVHITRADLRRAKPSVTPLAGANLQGADLRGMDLSEADLRGTNLQGAQLQNARLCRADLRGADLLLAMLDGADLRGANLKGALMTDAQLASVSTLVGATLPDGSLYLGPLSSGGCFCPSPRARPGSEGEPALQILFPD